MLFELCRSTFGTCSVTGEASGSTYWTGTLDFVAQVRRARRSQASKRRDRVERSAIFLCSAKAYEMKSFSIWQSSNSISRFPAIDRNDLRNSVRVSVLNALKCSQNDRKPSISTEIIHFTPNVRTEIAGDFDLCFPPFGHGPDSFSCPHRTAIKLHSRQWGSRRLLQASEIRIHRSRDHDIFWSVLRCRRISPRFPRLYPILSWPKLGREAVQKHLWWLQRGRIIHGF